MKKNALLSIVLAGVGLVGTGCLGRVISEGAGAVLGARGKVVDIKRGPSLTRYHALRVESLSVSPGLMPPSSLAGLVRGQFMKAGQEAGLATSGRPMVLVEGEIIHYEAGGAVDTAIGPLEEVIIRTRLMDGESHRLLAEANLVGRSKATSSSGPENLSEGAGRALAKWLEEAGLRKAKEKD